MAVLRGCKYCGGKIWNAFWHEKCRLALAEDLLVQIKQIVAEGKIGDLPGDLREKILSENWEGLPVKKTPEEIFEEGLDIPETLLESRR